MFRNQYDTDVTTWSPQGRIFQVEYAMEAVKQGGCVVGIRSKTHAVLAALKLSQADLSSYQKKIFKVDDHVGIAVSGLIGDGRILSRYMRNECLNHKFVYESPLPVSRLVRDVADRHQVATARSWKRPFGVGLLVVGFDKTGPHLFQTCPSGNYWEYFAVAIGSRSQASKTYLEKKFDSFESSSLEDLIKHAMFALEESCSTRKEGEKDSKLTTENCTVAVVGEGKPLLVLDGQEVAQYVEAIHAEGPTQSTAPTQAMSVDAAPTIGATEGQGTGETGGTGEEASGPAEPTPAEPTEADEAAPRPMEEG